MSRRLKITAATVAVAALIFVGGPWVYINVIRDPAPESFLTEAATTTVVALDEESTTEPPDPADTAVVIDDPMGTWRITSESQVGYRVDEVLFGQNVTAVGRTADVTGSLLIGDGAVTSGEFTVDMTTVRSDEPKRDAQFEGRIMDVINYPTASFVLTSPIPLDSAATTSPTTRTAMGNLTLRGVTKPVTVTVVGEIRNTNIVVTGEFTVTFAEWGIPNPSIPGISTEDFGVLEFQLVLER
ncbi:MAG: hypothetical protein RLZZ327_499 [Actinomycetota bacterium]